MLLRILKSKFIGFKLNLIFVIINNKVHMWGASLFFIAKKGFLKKNKASLFEKAKEKFFN